MILDHLELSLPERIALMSDGKFLPDTILSEKIAAQIDKFRSIVEKCSAEQTDILMQEIEHTFSI